MFRLKESIEKLIDQQKSKQKRIVGHAVEHRTQIHRSHLAAERGVPAAVGLRFAAERHGYRFLPAVAEFPADGDPRRLPLIFVQGGEQISSSEGYGVVVGGVADVVPDVYAAPTCSGAANSRWPTHGSKAFPGFTTTGSTSLSNVEALPKGLLFWRASTHWLGGVGVVMFVLVVLPSMGSTKMRLSSVELSSMAKDNFRYRTQKTLQILIVVYVGLTLIQTVLLKIVGMGWFDAVCNSFSTIATGGFCTRNSSIASFNNAGVGFIVMFFMLVSGLHFGLIYGTLTGKNNNIFKSEISKYYIFSTLAGGVVIAISLWLTDIYPNIWISLKIQPIPDYIGRFDHRFRHGRLVGMDAACHRRADAVHHPVRLRRVDRERHQMRPYSTVVQAMKAAIIQRQHPNAIIRVKLNG